MIIHRTVVSVNSSHILVAIAVCLKLAALEWLWLTDRCWDSMQIIWVIIPVVHSNPSGHRSTCTCLSWFLSKPDMFVYSLEEQKNHTVHVGLDASAQCCQRWSWANRWVVTSKRGFSGCCQFWRSHCFALCCMSSQSNFIFSILMRSLSADTRKARGTAIKPKSWMWTLLSTPWTPFSCLLQEEGFFPLLASNVHAKNILSSSCQCLISENLNESTNNKPYLQETIAM